MSVSSQRQFPLLSTVLCCKTVFIFVDEILRVNDSVLKIMIEYKKVVEGISEENGIGTLTSSPTKGEFHSKLEM